jgi:hypothetical protein
MCLQEFRFRPGFSGNQWRERNFGSADTVYTVERMKPEMTREEIGQKMDELAHKYVETHDREIIKELLRLGRELEKLEKLEKQ